MTGPSKPSSSVIKIIKTQTPNSDNLGHRYKATVKISNNPVLLACENNMILFNANLLLTNGTSKVEINDVPLIKSGMIELETTDFEVR
ncbi:hypothetical protein GCM10011538_10020 [Ligilactobacillus murinus]